MFCKWCGADMPKSAKRCARCGKDVPAMSDCGGFYDLTPPVREPVVVSPPVGHYPPPREPERKEQKSSSLLLILCGVGFGIVLILLLVVNIRLGNIRKELADVSKKIDELSYQLFDEEALSDVDASTEAPTESVTEPSTELPTTEPETEVPTVSATESSTEPPTEPSIAGQDVSIDIDMAKCDSETKAVTCITEAEITGEYSVTKANSRIDLSLPDHKNCIRITTADNSSAKDGEVKISFTVNEKAFGKAEGDAEYKFEYCSADSDTWMPLNIGNFNIQGDSFSYSAEDLGDVLNGSIELRLTYTRKNADGKTLTLIISGLPVPERAQTPTPETQNTTTEGV